MTDKPNAPTPRSEDWPEELMLRDTKLHDELGGLGQRIFTTAGQGYQKIRYVRADLLVSLTERVAAADAKIAAQEKLLEKARNEIDRLSAGFEEILEKYTLHAGVKWPQKSTCEQAEDCAICIARKTLTEKTVDLSDIATAKFAAQEKQIEELRKDAQRYRWLREQHWNDSPMSVVVDPKHNVILGADCPSEDLLDAAIDAAMSRKE